MNFWQTCGEVLTRWTDAVAARIIATAGRFVSPRVVRLVEQNGNVDTFTLQGDGKATTAGQITFANGRFSGGDLASLVKGSQVELVLGPKRFLVRPLELPARASEFIEGIIRVQIDRLTPWTAAEAVFGFSEPVAAGSGRIMTTIAATTRVATEPYVDGVAVLNPASVSIFTRAGEEARDLIRVFEQQTRGLLDRARLSRLLRVVLAGAAAAAVLSTIIGSVIGGYLDSRRNELNGELTARRIALRLDSSGTDLPPVAALARRKHERQANVIALEELSRILPDNTYVTELHIDGDTLQLVGVTSDAPSLIRLMEQSEHFSRATFFAPTTRAPSDPRDRFHIEAKLEPINTVSR
jgi:general secretion pathway protein L